MYLSIKKYYTHNAAFMPYYLTTTRLALTFVISLALIWFNQSVLVIRLFIVFLLALTILASMLGGYLIQKKKKNVQYWQFFDMTVDRIFLIIVLAALLKNHRVDVIPYIIIIAYELLIAATQEFMATNSLKKLDGFKKYLSSHILSSRMTRLHVHVAAIFMIILSKDVDSLLMVIGNIILWLVAIANIFICVMTFKKIRKICIDSSLILDK